VQTDTKVVLYAAIISGDFDALSEFTMDDVELNISGFPSIRPLGGRGEMVAAARRNYAQLESQQSRRLKARSPRGRLDCRSDARDRLLRSTGQAYSVRGVQWFTFAAGRISKIDQVVASIWKARPWR